MLKHTCVHTVGFATIKYSVDDEDFDDKTYSLHPRPGTELLTPSYFLSDERKERLLF